MKIYLCSHCNQTIPLAELATHRKACGPASDIFIKQGLKGKMRRLFKALFLGLLACVLGAASLWLGKSSFDSIAAMRRVERIPPTVVDAALPGEVNLNGLARVISATVKAPRTGTECLYYRYLVERKERDSDGDTRWVTQSDEARFTSFVLEDETGTITVHPDGGVDFNMEKSFSTTVGDYRYSEWRIDPGNRVFVLGYARALGPVLEVSFGSTKHYDPIISKYGETRERLNMAGASIAKCWGGLVALAFAVALATGLLRVHRLLVYFGVLSTLIVVYLSVLGLRMMRADLVAGMARLDAHQGRAVQELERSLSAAGVQWDGEWGSLGSLGAPGLNLAPGQVRRLNRIRLDVALAVARVRRQRGAFPERFLAPRWGIPEREPLPLPDDQRVVLGQLAARFRKAKVPGFVGWGVEVGALVVAVIAFLLGFRKVRFKRCMENLPTSPTGGAAYGLSEFKGVVTLPDMQEPSGPLTSSPCAQYHYVVKEHRGSGKQSKWVTIVDEKQAIGFLCRDADGEILVDPDGATVMTVHNASRREGKYRYSETRLEVDDPLYAIGECVIEPTQGDVLYLRKPDGDYPFVLSNCPESAVMRRMAAAGIALLNVSFAAVLLLALVLFGMSGAFAATDYLAAALAAPIFMTAVTLALHFNDLVFLRERANRNWSNIDVSLKKRHDLVPALAGVAEAYMGHEAALQESVALLRSTYDGGEAGRPDAVGRFMDAEHAAIGRILGVVEDYPELKADKTAMLLMRSLIVLENEVSLIRTGYNDAVELYNTRIQTLPDLIFARLFGFREKDLIHAESVVVRVPPSIQNLWEEDRLDKGVEAVSPSSDDVPAPVLGNVPPSPLQGGVGVPAASGEAAHEIGDGAPSLTDARAVIYALLLSSDGAERTDQLALIAREDVDTVATKAGGLVEAVSSQIADEVGRLQEAEKWFEPLRGLSPGGYKRFRSCVRQLMEHDGSVSLLEYALQKSMTRWLDPVFGFAVERPIRHRDPGLLVDPIRLILSRLSHAEAEPSESAGDAFTHGLSLLNGVDTGGVGRLPPASCALAALDAALEEVAHATNMVKANVLYACAEAVRLNDDYTYDQALLLLAMADVLDQRRPDWIFGGEED